jgi:hypothetical protein
VFKDAKEYAKSCDVCQRTGRPSRISEFPLHPVVALQAFDKWEVDFIRPINPPARHSRARYIIIATDYLPLWAEAAPTRDCNTDTSARFIFENIISRFDCPRSLTTDQGKHFMSATIQTLTQEFMV